MEIICTGRESSKKINYTIKIVINNYLNQPYTDAVNFWILLELQIKIVYGWHHEWEYEANPVFLLATRAGKMGLSCPLGIVKFVPAKEIIGIFMDLDFVSGHKNAKKKNTATIQVSARASASFLLGTESDFFCPLVQQISLTSLLDFPKVLRGLLSCRKPQRFSSPTSFFALSFCLYRVFFQSLTCRQVFIFVCRN